MMKLSLLILIGTFFTSLTSFAQDTLPHLNYSLVATRNSKHVFYKPGTRLVIKYTDGSLIHRAKGILAGGLNGRIAIKRKRSSKDLTFIPVEAITMIRKIHPQTRLTLGIIGTGSVVGGTAILNNSGKSPGSAMRSALAIPVIGLGTYVLLAVPASLVVEQLNEKIRDNGWKFELSGQ